MTNKKNIAILAITLLLVLIPAASALGGDNFQVTSEGTVFNTPSKDVDLIKSEDGVEVYGFEKNDHCYYAIIFNYKENPDLYDNLSAAVCHGEKFEEQGVTFYEQKHQELGNSFNMWTGENLALKEKTLDGSFAKNDTTGECIFVISTNYLYVVDSMKDIEWYDK